VPLIVTYLKKSINNYATQLFSVTYRIETVVLNKSRITSYSNTYVYTKEG